MTKPQPPVKTLTEEELFAITKDGADPSLMTPDRCARCDALTVPSFEEGGIVRICVNILCADSTTP